MRGVAIVACAVLLLGCRADKTQKGTLACSDCEAIGQPAYVWMNPEASALACTAPWGTTVTLHSQKGGRWLVTVGDECSGYVSASLVQVIP